MKSLKTLGMLAFAAAFSINAYAVAPTTNTTKKVKLCDFAPINNRKIPVGTMDFAKGTASGIDEASFNKIIDTMMSIYTPIVASKGGTLQFNRLWSDDTVNSSAERQGKKWIVNAYGGLARYPSMTVDGMTMVFCHELGHHMGGYPKFPGFGNTWASVEGEADYFATMKCFRRVFQDEDNTTAVQSMKLPKQVVAGCSAEFKDAKTIALCERSSMIGLVLADVLWDLGKDGGGEPANSPLFTTPATNVVGKTNADHPLAQCRLDTYFNGSICPMAYTDDFGAKDPVTGSCAMEKQDKVGYRPVCWYKPKASKSFE